MQKLDGSNGSLVISRYLQYPTGSTFADGLVRWTSDWLSVRLAVFDSRRAVGKNPGKWWGEVE